MHSHLDRADLLTRLVSDLRAPGDNGATAQLATFGRAVLRRVDDAYLYNHRLTTLGAQLRESFAWVVAAMASRGVHARVFHPQVATHGYTIDGCVIESVMPDQPFIFDTLKLFMRHARIRVLNSLHIILPAVLGPDGELVAINNGAPDAENFSYTRWFVEVPDRDQLDEIAAQVTERLTLAQAMVQDFQRMKRDVKAIANELDYLATLESGESEDCKEAADFLRWLTDDNFVFMGASHYGRAEDGSYGVREDRGLGAMRHFDTPHEEVDTSHAARFFAQHTTLAWPLARVRKATRESVLHRPGKVDEVLVRTFDHEGHPTGGLVLHGMFTFKGLGEPGGTIPILRRKLNRILASEQTVRSSYEHKTLLHAFNALPVEFLFEADAAVIGSIIRMTATADDARQIQAHIAAQPDARSAYAFVVLPKEIYSDDLRALLQSALQAELGSSYADHRVHLGKYGAVALHFYLTGELPVDSLDLGAIEARLVEIATPWQLRLQRALESELGDAQAADLYAKYAQAFPEGYTELTSVGDAVVDLQHLERVIDGGHTRFDIFASATNEADALLRIYHKKALLLTDILPVVDNFGVVVAEQYAFDIRPDHTSDTLTVNTLRVRRGDPDLLDQRKELIEALDAVFERRMRSDRINRLLLRGRIAWKEVDALRAYFNYSRQLGSQLTAEITQKVLMAHASFVHQLMELFRARFDPDTEMTLARRRDRVARLEARLVGYLDDVKGFEEDRVLRMFLTLVQATLRTNFYRPQPDEEHYLSFKVDCAAVGEMMPEPRPMFEIYVHHARVEGVHLRGGRVARGGLRWSDRLDDYRSEVLGLMATQVLKNTLIVPTGAKGGFVLKSPPEDWAEARAAADDLYRVFIRGLLDLTDNIIDGANDPPDRVVCYDEPDPYLVVAADKGTAHLSDTANALSARYGFWLGDAFASGGSVGYDHKKMGITARGAWVCVRRHFLELGVDPEKDVITVVGIGDMSGDVFGNGLLMSRTIELVAAFNHRHIFIDPNPNPETSFEERRRLFALPRSAWTDYSYEKLSVGGGIYDRSAKSIRLSEEARARLRVREEEVSGEALIRHILTADVDLLWNGGIGTYIKSSIETDAEVSDHDNDRVRVDANKLACRVIGEGGNLGVTMRGRVDFAAAGGRINLDAIDNSGGVDLSDHEVNLKTLLGPEVAAERLTKDGRDELLVAVGDAVCDAVLENTDSQCLAISLDEARSKRNIWATVHAMMYLREVTGFSRRVQRLPRGVEQIRQREALGLGFLRPELAKLLSYSKMEVKRGLQAAPIGSHDELRPFLVDYFPAAVVDAHGDALGRHLLFHEIAATVIVNRVIDAGGVTLFPRMAVATERPPSDIAAAYLVAEQLLELAPLREEVRGLEALSIDLAYRSMVSLDDCLARATRALLWTHPEPIRLATAGELPEVAQVAAALADGQLQATLPDRVRRASKDAAHELTTHGITTALAARLSRLSWLDHVFHIAQVARRTGDGPKDCARAYFAAGFRTGVLDLVDAIARQSYQDRWDDVAVHSIVRSLLESVTRLAVRARGDRRKIDDAWVAEVGLGETAARVEELMRERIPISAMLVSSERLKHRVDMLLTLAP